MKHAARLCGWPIFPADENSQSQKDSSPTVVHVWSFEEMEHGM